MTENKNNWRARPQDIEYASQLKFGSTLSYHTDHPREAITADNYFLTARNHVNRGDEIRVICMNDDGTWYKGLFEVAVLLETNVVVVQIGEWRHGGVEVVRNLVPKHRTGGIWDVVDAETGKRVIAGLGKAEAHAFVRERNPDFVDDADKVAA